MFLANYSDANLPLKRQIDEFRTSGAIARFASVRLPIRFHAVRSTEQGLVQQIESISPTDVCCNGGYLPQGSYGPCDILVSGAAWTTSRTGRRLTICTARASGRGSAESTMIAFNLPRTSRTVLCLGAHSDELEIGCGGTVLTLSELDP